MGFEEYALRGITPGPGIHSKATQLGINLFNRHVVDTPFLLFHVLLPYPSG